MSVKQLILNNVTIEHRESDNFINATQLARAGGKEIKHWFELKSTRDLIKELEQTLIKELNVAVMTATSDSNQMENNSGDEEVADDAKIANMVLVDVKRGGNKFAQGSWIHPDLAVPLAQWVSAKFAIQVSRWVRELMVTGHVSIESQKTNQELIELTNQLKIKEEQLTISESKNLNLVQKIQNSQLHKLGGWVYIATEHRYALDNHFRIGKTTNLNKRISAYRTGRTSADELYYVFIYKSEDIGLLEYILRALLKPYRENVHIDMYVIHWKILQPFVAEICNMFHNGIIPLKNTFIVDNSDCYDEPISPERLDIYNELNEFYEDDEHNNVEYMSNLSYYERINNLYKDYNITIHTKSEELCNIKAIVDVECVHARKQIKVESLLESLGCNHCIKDKITKEKTIELLGSKLDNFDDYDVIDHIDENSTEFLKLSKTEQNRVKKQNEVIARINTGNLALLSNYIKTTIGIELVCEYAHKFTTTWDLIRTRVSDICPTCRKLKKEVSLATIKKQTSEEDVIKIAKDLNWTHIRKTGTAGLMEWKCPNGHIVCKILRDLKRASCHDCKNLSNL